MVENSTTKRPQKDEIKAEKKNIYWGKIVMGKEVKSFQLVECHIKDAMIGKE
jgi:hypothetical protein